MKRFIKIFLLAILVSGTSFGFANSLPTHNGKGMVKTEIGLSVDLDGNNTKSVTMKVRSGEAFKLSIHSTQNLSAKIVFKDIHHKEISHTNTTIENGKNVFLFHVGEVKPGMYVIELQTENSTQLIPVLIQ